MDRRDTVRKEVIKELKKLGFEMPQMPSPLEVESLKIKNKYYDYDEHVKVVKRCWVIFEKLVDTFV
jgi:hypothetical protein